MYDENIDVNEMIRLAHSLPNQAIANAARGLYLKVGSGIRSGVRSLMASLLRHQPA